MLEKSGAARRPSSGSIATVLAEARASLRNPSRPFTPADTRLSRALFRGTDYRPSSRPGFNVSGNPTGARHSHEPGTPRVSSRSAREAESGAAGVDPATNWGWAPEEDDDDDFLVTLPTESWDSGTPDVPSAYPRVSDDSYSTARTSHERTFEDCEAATPGKGRSAKGSSSARSESRRRRDVTSRRGEPENFGRASESPSYEVYRTLLRLSVAAGNYSPATREAAKVRDREIEAAIENVVPLVTAVFREQRTPRHTDDNEPEEDGSRCSTSTMDKACWRDVQEGALLVLYAVAGILDTGNRKAEQILRSVEALADDATLPRLSHIVRDNFNGVPDYLRVIAITASLDLVLLGVSGGRGPDPDICCGRGAIGIARLRDPFLPICRACFQLSRDAKLDGVFISAAEYTGPAAEKRENKRQPAEESGRPGEARRLRLTSQGVPPITAILSLLQTTISESASSSRRTISGRRRPRSARPLWLPHPLTLESLIYATGVLKNISASSPARARLARCGAVPVLCTMLQRTHLLAKVPTEGTGGDRRACAQLLIQITATLRNLCTSRRICDKIAGYGTPKEFCGLFTTFGGERNTTELLLHAARCLGKLSCCEAARADINSTLGRGSDVNGAAALLRMLDVRERPYGPGLITKEAIQEEISMLLCPTQSQDKAEKKNMESSTLSLVVRISYTLGNLTSSNDENRVALGQRFDGVAVLASLINALGRSYLSTIGRRTAPGTHGSPKEGKKRDRKGRKAGKDEVTDSDSDSEEDMLPKISTKDTPGRLGDGLDSVASSPAEELHCVLRVENPADSLLIDALVKTIRLLANIAIHREVGASLAVYADPENEENIGDTLVQVVNAARGGKSEELMLNAVSAITNLSFYDPRQRRGGWIFDGRELTITSALLEVLLCLNAEAVAEAARAFGNFSRHQDFRKAMRTSRADEALVLLLQHPDRDVVCNSCGALINIAADKDHRRLFSCTHQLQAPTKLLDILRKAGLRDPGLSSLVCKTLYNLLMDVEAGKIGAIVGSTTFDSMHIALEELCETAEDTALRKLEENGTTLILPYDETLGEEYYGDFLAAANALRALLNDEETTLNAVIDIDREEGMTLSPNRGDSTRPHRYAQLGSFISESEYDEIDPESV